MEKRYEGFLAPHGLYVLDTYTGEVRFISHGEDIQSASLISVTPVVSESAAGSFSFAANTLSPFENEVISSYPYLIAKPFSDLVKEKDARMKCKLMVDTFTAVLKYMALQLASEYIRAKDVKDIQVHQTLTKDLSRPLISAWNLLIARCLPVLKDNKIPLFSPEMKDAYEKVESKCKDPFLVSHSYSDENGEIKTKTKKLGKIQALINYRNGLAHGFNQSQSRAQKEFDEYYPLLCDILQEVRYVSRYTLWHVESGRLGVNGIRLMGANPSMKKVDFDREGVNPAVSPLFLINDASGEILPLYAFFDVDNASEPGLPEIGKDVFVFEGNTKNTVIYLSSGGEHLEKSSRFQHWKDLLAQKQLEVEWADAKKLSLEVLQAIGTYISTPGIQALITSAKYLREASIPRQDLNEMLDSFSYGTFNGFVLGGESGIGKSTLLAQKTEEWQSAGHMVAFYRGSALNQSDIANKFLRDCALKVSYLEDFLSLANPLFSQSDKKCYLIIDALNEYAGDLNELIKSAENIVAQAAPYPWFKMIVSIRDSAYNRVSARFGELAPSQYFTVEEDRGGEKIKTNIIRLQPVAKGFVEQLYNAYREYKWKDSSEQETEGYYKFRPLTTYTELDPEGSTIQLIRSPLMARLIMQSFHRAKLPQQLDNDAAMRIYHDNIVLEKTESSNGFPERKKLLTVLVAEMDKNSIERLDRDELMKTPTLRAYLMNNQRDSAYIQLLELGVLMEEWETENCYVRFAFDKFLEFLLAEMHWPRINDSEDLMALCKRAVTYKILQGAIEIILIRFCLNNQSDQLVRLIDLADKETEPIQNLVRDTTARLLFTLCSEQPHVFDEVIEQFPKAPGKMDLLILKELLDKLFLTGNLAGFEKTIDIAVKESELLKDKKMLSDFMYSQAIYDGFQGRVNEALELLERTYQIKSEIGDQMGISNCLKEKGVRLYRMGKVDEAWNLYQEALTIKRSINDDLGASQCMNNLANIFSFRGEMREAEKLHLDSLEVKRQLGDKKGISASLNNLGSLYEDLGRIEDSEKHYLESLEIRRQLGDKHGISQSLNNIGILYRGLGRIKEAEKLYLESLEIRRQLGNKKGISNSLNSLGNLYKTQGRIEEAEKLFKESLEIERQLGDKKGISTSLNNLGNLCKDLGRIKEAEKFHLESLEIKRELGDKKGISSSLNSLGVLCKDQGRIKEAKNLLLESLEIKQQLGDKKGISQSLINLGILYKEIGMIDEAEKVFLESLEIKKKLSEKKGMGILLNNLAVLALEKNNLQSAADLFNESIQIKRELKEKGNLLAAIHRAFSIVSPQDQAGYMHELEEMEKKDFGKNELCWLANIELMHVCMNDDEINTDRIESLVSRIMDYSNDISVTDVDDLPVEAFYIASQKLLDLESPAAASKLAQKALEWIKDRNTRRKNELEKMVGSIKYEGI